jgi:4-hydroxybenzoate polyprenyltransferase
MIFGLSLAEVNIAQPQILIAISAFLLWGIASHAFGAVQDVLADREGGIASIATVIGARATVRVSLAAYVIAAALLLGLDQPYSFAAAAAIPYLVILSPFWNITDQTSAKANAGWKKFIWLNFIAGAVVTLLVL